jgi:hypothetical protein
MLRSDVLRVPRLINHNGPRSAWSATGHHTGIGLVPRQRAPTMMARPGLEPGTTTISDGWRLRVVLSPFNGEATGSADISSLLLGTVAIGQTRENTLTTQGWDRWGESECHFEPPSLCGPFRSVILMVASHGQLMDQNSEWFVRQPRRTAAGPALAGYCFVWDSERVRVTRAAAPAELQERRHGCEAYPFCRREGLRRERAGDPVRADFEHVDALHGAAPAGRPLRCPLSALCR